MRQPPPARFDGDLPTCDLDTGTVFARVHQTAYGATAFNPRASDVLFGGGRFDSTADDPYGYLYAAATNRAAIAETLLRDVPADDRGARFLAKKYWRGRQLSRLEVVRPIVLISLLSGEDLGVIGQDTWLTTCGPEDYPQTRAWAHWLRRTQSDAAGIAWLSKRQPGVPSLCLFEDRCPPGSLVEVDGPLPRPCIFEEDDGFDWLRSNLAAFRVSIRR
jgi:hypothetical protein